MKYITTILLALVILPAVALGGAVWSQNSVNNTYETRVAEIDATIEELTLKEASLAVYREVDWGQNPEIALVFSQRMEIRNEIEQLKEEKKILEVAYWLINESFETPKGYAD